MLSPTILALIKLKMAPHCADKKKDPLKEKITQSAKNRKKREKKIAEKAIKGM